MITYFCDHCGGGHDPQTCTAIADRPVACAACLGHGRRKYGSGSTWRGGVGICAITEGLCDKCWGSGDADRPFTNLREMCDRYEERIATATLEKLVATKWSKASELTAVAAVLKSIGEGRTARGKLSFWGMRLCEAIAHVLDTAAKESVR